MKLFFAAIAASLVSFTRIPVPWMLPKEAFPKASWHLPLIGWLLFSVLAAVLHAFGDLLPDDALIFLCLLLPILVTGGMHEDGLADAADGLFGGQTPERRLQIMKDPTVGSFGVIALCLLLLGEYLALKNISSGLRLQALAFALPVSRCFAVLLLKALPYLSSEKSRAAAYIQPASLGFLWTILWTLPALLWLPSFNMSLLLVALLSFASIWWLCRQKLGGVTGDCLGAAVKVNELVLLWTIAILDRVTSIR